MFGGAGLVNQSGGTVAGKFAVYGGDGATVSNAGSLAGLGSNGGAGVSLKASGTVGNLAGGEISGFLGVYAGTGAATVTNDGRILGDTAAGFGIVLNNGGSLGNQAGGAILGHIGLLANAAVSVSNAGSIAAGTATGDAGLRLNKGGSVSNATGGTIFCGYGIDAGGASVAIVNAGRIGLNATTALAVKVQAGGTLTNLASGTVIGLTALIAGSAPFSVVNAGRIDGQTLSGGGVSLTAGGLVSNQSGGTIQAGVGVRVQGGAGTVANDGRIAGFAGAAVSFAAGFANRAIVGTGASFLGAVDGGNTIGATVVSTLELASAASTGTLSGIGTSVVNFGSIVFDAGSQWFLQGNAAGFAGTIAGFAAGDTIEIAGINATGSNYAGGVLTLTTGSGTTSLSLTGASPFSTGNFRVTNVGGNVDISLACFRAGTRIRTPDGDVAVEDLRVGGAVCTLLDGPARRIAWIGHRTVDCRRHPRPEKVLPIRVSAGAFGPGLPARPLYLSPDHAVYVGDVLIPVGLLTNGRSIAQVPVDEVTYYHIELPEHDVVLAEGLPAESFLDTGNRANFENSEGATRLWPDFSMPPNHVSAIWEAQGCAPLVVHGAILDSVRAGLDFLEFENFALDADAGRG